MKHLRFLVLVLSVVLISSLLPVVGVTQNRQLGVWQDKGGFQVLTKSNAPVRESPPSQGFFFLGGPGKQISELMSGEKVEVVDYKEVSTLFNKYLWVKVEKRGSSGQPVSGWVFWGNAKDRPVNFEPPK